MFARSIVALALAAAVPISAKGATTLDADDLLAGTRVVPVAITLPTDDWDALRRESRGPGGFFGGGQSKSFTWHQGRVTIDGVTIVDAGVRKKGLFGSIDSVRPSMLVDFNRYVPQHPVDGLRRLTLNNNKQDTSCVSQCLAYALFRAAGVPAPRVGFAAVTVNDEFLGLYSNVEAVKKPFLRRSFGSSTGSLYEGTLADLVPSSLGKLEIETHDDSRRQLERLARLLEAEPPLDLRALETLVDLDAFLSSWAIESLIGLWDGYTANQNNYFVYFPSPGSPARFIPWGADSAFPAASGGMPGFSRGPSPVISAQSALANRLAFTPGVMSRYRARLEEILATVWREEDLLAEIDRLETLLTPHLSSAQEGMPKSLETVRGFVRRRRDDIEKALADWPPELPSDYRRPMVSTRIGSAHGSFSTMQRSSADGDAPSGEASVAITVRDEPFEFVPTGVSAYPFVMGGRAPSTQALADAPIAVTVSGTRGDGSALTLSFMLDRRLVRDSNTDLAAGGMLTEGPGFFGKGPMRIVSGTVALTARGADPESPIAGSFQFVIDENSGGFNNPSPKKKPPEN